MYLRKKLFFFFPSLTYPLTISHHTSKPQPPFGILLKAFILEGASSIKHLNMSDSSKIIFLKELWSPNAIIRESNTEITLLFCCLSRAIIPLQVQLCDLKFISSHNEIKISCIENHYFHYSINIQNESMCLTLQSMQALLQLLA